MKLSKKKLLILTDWYLPAVNAGGPVRSVAAIVSALKSDFEISVLTSDRDFGDDEPFDGIETDVWLIKEEFRLQYVSPDLLKRTIREEVNQDYHKIYLNSLFSRHFTISALRGIKTVDKHKVVIAPRGMLGEGALGLKSFKKKTFLRIAKAIGLYNSVTWHASTELETKEILNVFPKANVVALENLSFCNPEEYAGGLKQNSKLRMVFVSRISLKKNLLFLLQLINDLDEEHISLDIYGPIEDVEYWGNCSSIIAEKPTVEYKGIIQPDKLHGVLKEYDLFVLPTLNENYGHIILEALNSSLPLLLSNKTPWLNLKELGVGVEIPLDDDLNWKQTILQFKNMPAKEYENVRKAAWTFGQKKLKQQYLIKEYCKLFS